MLEILNLTRLNHRKWTDFHKYSLVVCLIVFGGQGKKQNARLPCGESVLCDGLYRILWRDFQNGAVNKCSSQLSTTNSKKCVVAKTGSMNCGTNTYVGNCGIQARSKNRGKGVTRMSGNSSDDGEVAPPGVAEGGYVTADAYKAALEENALLSSENERLKRHIIELEKAGVADGRRGRNATRMKKNKMV